MPADPYDAIASYYDVGMAGFDDDLSLYFGIAKRNGGSILELGCGTGRLTQPLSAAGFEVIGIDRSAQMLDRALERLSGPAGPRLIRGTMIAPPLKRKFSLIIVAIDTFLHLESQEEQIACLSASRQLLDEGGTIVVDLPSPSAPGWEDWSAGMRPIVPVWSARLEDGSRVDKFSTFATDPSAQTHDVTEFYDRVLPDGMLQRTSVEYALRFVFPAELELLLRIAGLRLVDRYGDYELGPFTAGSERLIGVAAAAPSNSLAGSQAC
jgi:SAM-dependent methyltransferase